MDDNNSTTTMIMKDWYPSRGTEGNPCIKYNVGGFPFEEFSCLYPSLGSTYLAPELKYDTIPVRDWMLEHPVVPIVACVLYAVGIVLGRRYFDGRDRWNWRWTLAAWNLLLSVFSCIGFCRTAPAIVHLYTTYSWQENLCFDPESHFGSGTVGLWVQLFCLSKFPELLDTFFIVIHKKPLLLLHWYHHISVLLYCWHSYVYKAPAGILFCVMNYAVHSIMYFYYFLMAVRAKPKWFNAMYITVAQISQMVVGVAATVACNYLFFVVKPHNCYLSGDNNIAALIMYGSYLALFLQFFLGRYFGGASSKKDKKKTTTTTANGAVPQKKFV
mmetsp:Transcript_11101/g.24852  ORF Transcript_11101/g.24852 Transcript_11101/m.24852 type:complete len:328 (+) Transcript_11101:135-1118(+)|eukprot:CAMPEP_0168738036 /NCGR_PEP_ID=MMETSP0724-20121128/10718_1 /TAXON_ID=265536 /ORGANISM="Amphiprora sp., Strain CCMP467" /LENGTH=327 /DNA_ID=CAMNT_0008785351 /DNA_START=60 /DNA_END=1043 /DNA_ORIENTATION=-